jgi:hypothetical protein
MISHVTGEVTFADGLRFAPQEELAENHLRTAKSHQLLAEAGWSQHVLGVHRSDHGDFEVEAISDRYCRIQMVLLAHSHPFYLADTRDDSERRAFHDGVLASDSLGQRSFSWGEVFCRLDPAANRDWIVVVYSLGPHVPRLDPAPSPQLHEHQPEPDPALTGDQTTPSRITSNLHPGSTGPDTSDSCYV